MEHQNSSERKAMVSRSPKTVFVLGELNADLIMTGENIQPEWNREKLVDSFRMVLGSSSAITACGLAGLGLEVYFIGIVGDDEVGRFCVERLREKGVRTDYILTDPIVGTGVTLSMSTSKDRALLTYMGTIASLKLDHLSPVLFEEADHIHFGSYYLQQGMRNEWVSLFAQAQAKGIGTSFDTGWDPEEQWHQKEIKELLQVTDLFLPSGDEANRIFEVTADGSGGLKLLADAMPTNRGEVYVKLGAEGAAHIGKEGLVAVRPAFKITPIDTTGAGDSFNAGLIYAKLTGMEKQEWLAFASACGAIATQRIGGASSVPNVHEVEQFIRLNRN